MFKKILIILFVVLTPGLSEAGQWYSEIAYSQFNYERQNNWYDYDKDLHSKAISIEKSTNEGSFSISAGYQFNDILGLQLGYTKFNPHITHYVPVTNYTIFYGSAGDYSSEKIDGLHLDGILSKRFGSFSPYLQLGVLFPDEIAPIAGAGIRWDISNIVGLNLYWEKYFNAAERHGVAGSYDDEKTDVESYNLGLRYTF
ncbi:hypothetical protein [Microbulbifer hainanensis]|uniref:hypothetical protein n=1 Tax=Microbulbifer hainanensis TaxID=2735675 RepID=UPI0018663DA0|nr:hypothetical protein [Microbulbifer hainanensis]